MIVTQLRPAHSRGQTRASEKFYPMEKVLCLDNLNLFLWFNSVYMFAECWGKCANVLLNRAALTLSPELDGPFNKQPNFDQTFIARRDLQIPCRVSLRLRQGRSLRDLLHHLHTEKFNHSSNQIFKHHL